MVCNLSVIIPLLISVLKQQALQIKAGSCTLILVLFILLLESF